MDQFSRETLSVRKDLYRNPAASELGVSFGFWISVVLSSLAMHILMIIRTALKE